MRRLSIIALLSLSMLAIPIKAPAQDIAVQRQDAVERGVAYLMQLRDGNGAWPHSELGMTALGGLTLLECGVAKDEPGMQQTIAHIRRNCVNLTFTYSIALCLLFLDRLGDPDDIPLIESLAVRLLAGQGRTGGYTYQCPMISGDEARRLNTNLMRRNELIGRVNLPANKADGQTLPRRTARDLPGEIQKQLLLINASVSPVDHGRSDNSNTQFATLALWAARKHGLPVDGALARIDTRFRTTQTADGGWMYMNDNARRSSSLSMTCAGLLGLAVAHGSLAAQIQEKNPKAKGGRDIAKDPVMVKGLLALGVSIDHPLAKRARGKAPRARHIRADGTGYYFLWSLERLAVALDLNTIGGKDWYAWGSEVLVDSQLPDGSWQGSYGLGGADTCFALLFLKRANLVKDLTAQLKGRLKDEAVMRASKVGGDNTRVPEVAKKALDPSETKPPQSEPAEAKNTAKAPPGPPRESAKNPAADKPPKRSESERLARAFIDAPANKQEQALDKLREAKGTVNTEALALAIPLLEDRGRQKAAREALAERLARMKDETLGLYLKDDDAEIRRAAALACALKESKALIPHIIPLLDDPQKDIVPKAAQLALKALAGQDLGPSRNAWQAWWDKQGK